MKEIKAHVPISKVDDVVHALRGSGARGITVTRVHGVGHGYEPYLFSLTPSELKNPEIAKVEVVCTDDCAEAAVTVIVEAARTGDPGDGIVFVTPVQRAARIRTGEEALRALEK